jgi:hypothetical protein
LPRRFTHIRRRVSIVSAEHTIEIRQIAEADLEGDGTDRSFSLPRVTQQPMRACQALTENEFRKRSALVFEQPLDISRRDAMATGQTVDREHTAAEVLDDIVFDGAQR